jgi:hypothetical protein
MHTDITKLVLGSTPPPPQAPKHSGAFLQPDLADGEDEVINQDIIELQKKLHQAVKVLKFFFLLSVSIS